VSMEMLTRDLDRFCEWEDAHSGPDALAEVVSFLHDEMPGCGYSARELDEVLAIVLDPDATIAEIGAELMLWDRFEPWEACCDEVDAHTVCAWAP